MLKLPEIFQFSKLLKDTLDSYSTGFSLMHVSILVSIAGYIIFFIFVALASLNVVIQLQSSPSPENLPKPGPIVAGCVIALTITYLLVFSVAIYSSIGH